MAYVTDLTHFDGVLDPGTTAPRPAKRLAKFLNDIVRIASRETNDGTINTDVRCFKRPARRACEGRIESTRVRGKETIEWRCPVCGESGFISNWRGSSADLSRFGRENIEVRPPAPRASPEAFMGRWRITDMELWSEDAFDLLGPAFFEFNDDLRGEFQFIAVRGWLDCRYSERDGQPFVEFTWEGEDEGDPRCGRGWAVVSQSGVLEGRFFFHRGDDSAFTARKN